MSGPRLAAALGLALAVAGWAPPGSAGPAPARDLDPYRLFVKTEGARVLLASAREAMRGYWGADQAGAGAAPADWPGPPVAIYVSLVGPDGTRACVGGAGFYRRALSETVRSLAVRALHSDPRHAPVREEELPKLRIAISFAGEGESIADPMRVDPGREGLLVSSGGRSVAFLPGEARTVAWALREARRIHVLEGSGDGADYRQFPVVVLAEPSPPDSTREDSDATR